MSYEEYEKWRRDNGVGVKGGVGAKRKLHKVPKGIFTAAGKHPIGALKEKIPTCEFTEVEYLAFNSSFKLCNYDRRS